MADTAVDTAVELEGQLPPAPTSNPTHHRQHTMKNYSVMVPMAGHVCLSVEAESEYDAKEKALNVAGEALDRMLKDDDGQSGAEFMNVEVLYQFNKGNVCYCPEPWEVEAEEE